MKLLPLALLLQVAGCGGIVLESTAKDAALEEAAVVDTAVVDTFDTAPVTPSLGDVSGTYLMSCMITLGGGNPALQFLFRVDLVASRSKVDFKARVFLESASSFSSGLLTGAPLGEVGIPAGDLIPVRLDSASIPGNAQRISDNDLLFEEVGFDIIRRDRDTLCAEWNGRLTKPFEASLDGPGDFCVLRPWSEGAPFPTSESDGTTFFGYPAEDFHCP